MLWCHLHHPLLPELLQAELFLRQGGPVAKGPFPLLELKAVLMQKTPQKTHMHCVSLGLCLPIPILVTEGRTSGHGAVGGGEGLQ